MDWSPERKHLHSEINCARCTTDDQADFGLDQTSSCPRNLILTDKFKALAQQLNSTPSQIALAWILADFDNCELH